MKKKKLKSSIKKETLNPETLGQPSQQDPGGSYTGVPVDGGKPVQDADDL